MSDQFLGEIRAVGFNFAPRGWALCNGQTLSIQQNAALFALLGTTFGGDGIRTFQLPNLQSRVAVHSGTTYSLGETAGIEGVSLIVSEMPSHSHTIPIANVPATLNDPSQGVYAVPNVDSRLGGNYQTNAPNSATGGLLAAGSPVQPHSNLQPYLTMNYIIALIGIFPSRN